jgi:hypothetical protein
MNFIKTKAATLISLALVSASANAAVVFGNLGSDGSANTNTTGTTVTTNTRNLTSWNFAQGFTVSSPGWIIDSVTAGFTGISTIKLSIYSDASGSPGSELASDTVSVNNSTINGQTSKVTFNLPSVALSTGSLYWIVADKVSSETDIFTWLLASGSAVSTEQNTSGWVNSGYARRPESGGAWATLTDVGNNYVSMSIQATVVPEPGSLAVTAVLSVGALLHRNRRRQTAV